MADEMERDEGSRMTLGESLCLINSAKWTSIVLTSAETNTRPLKAANFNTSESGVLSGITPTLPSKTCPQNQLLVRGGIIHARYRDRDSRRPET